MDNRRILDSGNREHFSTGAVRDTEEGKGRCDLLPLNVVARLLRGTAIVFCGDNEIKTLDSYLIGSIFYNLDNYYNTSESEYAYSAIISFSNLIEMDKMTLMLEVSKHFEEGAKKYAENNWRLGIPMHRYLDSAVRHLLKFLRGDTDEPHDRAFVWNLMCCLWTQERLPEMRDFPMPSKKETTNG